MSKAKKSRSHLASPQAPAKSAGEVSFWNRGGVQAAVLLVVAVLVYIPSYSAGFIWDDDLYMLNNRMVTGGWSGLWGIWTGQGVLAWFPITFSSFWVEWRLWGVDPAGYHATNAVLHAISALLVWRVLGALKVPAAWLAALLYAVHPLCVTSVTWIAERKNTLSMVFFALSLLCYLRFEDRRGDRMGRRWYLVALVAFVAALLSKPSVVALPVILLLFAWWRRGAIGWRDIYRTLPFFGAALAVGLVTIKFEHHVSAPETASEGLLIRLLAGSRALWAYIGHTLLPVNLAMIYPRWEIKPHSVVAYLPAALAVVLLLVFWFCRRQSWGRAGLFAAGYILLALAPVLGAISMNFFSYSQRSDHLEYLAIPGIVAAAAAAGWWLLHRGEGFAFRWAARVLALGFVVWFGVLAWQRQAVFSSQLALWTDNLPKNPGSWKVRNNLASALAANGRAAESIEQYREALRLRPDYPDLKNTLGALLTDLGRFDEAKVYLVEAIRQTPKDPLTHYNLGNLLGRQGDRAGGIAEYRAALELAPNDSQLHNNLGCLLMLEGQHAAATNEFQQAIRLQPENVEAYNNLGSSLLEMGRPQEAVNPLSTAVRYNPRFAEAHCNLGNALAALNKPDAALAEYQAALRLNPNYPMARYKLGDLLLGQGQAQAAAGEFRAALVGDPNLAEAHYRLATMLGASQHLGEAVEHYKAALRSKPDWIEALNNLAWLLATCPDPTRRDGKEATRLASHAVELTKNEDPEALDTLAAAYAENEQYAEAVKAARQALALPSSTNTLDLVAGLKARLALYEASKPFRQMAR